VYAIVVGWSEYQKLDEWIDRFDQLCTRYPQLLHHNFTVFHITNNHESKDIRALCKNIAVLLHKGAYHLHQFFYLFLILYAFCLYPAADIYGIGLGLQSRHQVLLANTSG